MTIMRVVEWPEKVLETKAAKVTKFDDELRRFVRDMHETMDHAKGIGLAANQVGVLQRVITIHIPYQENRYSNGENKREPWHNVRYTFINPEITKKAGKICFQEGCLSFPEIFEFVDRASEVWVKAQDEHGNFFEVHANDLFAVCLQHEIDHIDGIVFIKRMSRLKASLIRKRIMRKGAQNFMETEESKA